MVDTTFFKNNGPFKLSEIAKVCNAELTNADKSEMQIFNIATMAKATEGALCFFYDKKAKEKAAEIKASACVTTPDLVNFVPQNVVVLTTANPKLAFLLLNKKFYSEIRNRAEISRTAKIAPSVKIGENAFIGEHVVIEDDVEIGNNCYIEHNAVISRGCKIGNNCRIGANASVAYTIMGNDCYIYAGARIGQDGFGFMVINGKHERIPQLGRVIIGNDVEIAANTCVDRGALDDTVIGDGCRIDNLVQVAHNDKLGRGCVIVSQTGIAGSCTFGDYVVCGGQSGFADHLNIGSGAQIGAQSGLMRDVEPGAVVMGYPAVPIKEFMRQVACVQKLTKNK